MNPKAKRSNEIDVGCGANANSRVEQFFDIADFATNTKPIQIRFERGALAIIATKSAPAAQRRRRRC